MKPGYINQLSSTIANHFESTFVILMGSRNALITYTRNFTTQKGAHKKRVASPNFWAVHGPKEEVNVEQINIFLITKTCDSFT